MKASKKQQIAILLVSICLLIVSLTQQSYCSPEGCGDAMAAFVLGAIGFVEGGATLTWLANPLLIVAWITIKKWPRLAFGCSLFATVIGLSFMGFNTIIADEAGNYENITGYAAGYWLWIASMAVMLLGNGYLIFTQKTTSKDQA